MKKRMLIMLALFSLVILMSNISIIRTVVAPSAAKAAAAEAAEKATKDAQNAIEKIYSRIKLNEGFIEAEKNKIYGSGPTFAAWTKLLLYKEELANIEKALGVDQVRADYQNTIESSNEGAADVLAATLPEYQRLNEILDNQIFNNAEVTGIQKKIQALTVQLNAAIAKSMDDLIRQALIIVNNKNAQAAREKFAATLAAEKAAAANLEDQIAEKMRSDPTKIARINELKNLIAQETANLYENYGKDKSGLEILEGYEDAGRRLELLRRLILNIPEALELTPDKFFAN